MSIVVSNKRITVQFIDDEKSVTLASARSEGDGAGKNIAAAERVGRAAAEAAQRAGISRAVVDRGGHKYHGRVKAVVEAAEAGGILVGGGQQTVDDGRGPSGPDKEET